MYRIRGERAKDNFIEQIDTFHCQQICFDENIRKLENIILASEKNLINKTC